MAAARARAIAIDWLNGRIVARSLVASWRAAGALLAQSGTARVVGCWVEVTWAACNRVVVVCGLAWPLGRAPELWD